MEYQAVHSRVRWMGESRVFLGLQTKGSTSSMQELGDIETWLQDDLSQHAICLGRLTPGSPAAVVKQCSPGLSSTGMEILPVGFLVNRERPFLKGEWHKEQKRCPIPSTKL